MTAKRTLTLLVQPLAEVVATHADAFLKKTEAQFMLSAERARTNREEDELFAAVKILQDHGEALVKAWVGNLHHQAKEPIEAVVDEGLPDADALNLVDTSNFNEWVLIAGVANRVEAQFATPLYELEQRLSLLCHCKVEGENNPFSPTALLKAFHTAIEPHHPPAACQHLILRGVEREILSHLDTAYASMNTQLEQLGIRPDLRYRPEYRPGLTEPRSPASTKGAEAPSGRNTHPPNTAYSAPPGRPVPPGERGATAAFASAKQGADAVHDLIGSMQTDQRLPVSFKELMSHLESSLVTLAQEEPDFLLDPTHPAMEVINNLEKLSLAASAEQGPESRGRSLKRVVESTVADLAAHAHGGVAAFTHARETLLPAVEKSERAFKANANRVLGKYQGQEKLLRARSRVTEVLTTLLGERRQPRVLIKLLRLGWESLLTLTLLGKGEESPEWRGYLSVVERLQGWFDEGARALPEAPEQIAEVIEILEQGVTQVSVNPVALDRLVDSMRKALEGNHIQFRKLQRDRLQFTAGSRDEREEGSIKSAGQGKGSTVARWQQLIRALKSGDLLVEKMSGEWRRYVTLTWIGNRGKLFVFVDGKGMEALALDLNTLAHYLHTGRLELVDDGITPLSQQSITRVVQRREPAHSPETGGREAEGKDQPPAADSPVSRRALYAVMLTDIVGYSRMMEHDEGLAFKLLQQHNDLIREVIGSYRGEEIKTMGDAFLVVFTSAVDATCCALEIHRRVSELGEGVAPEMAIALRIGIHVGDVIRMGQDVFGDGINVVSRIEPLAHPGGTCLSDGVYSLVRKQMALKVEEMDFCELKNISMPPKLYQVTMERGEG